MLEYRAEITLWAVSGLLPLIMLALWTGIENPLVNYLELNYLKRYFISAFIVRQFTAVWVMITFEEDHLDGKLSPYLLQPITPFWRYVTSHLAEQFTRIPIVVIMLIIIFSIIPYSFWLPSLSSLIFGIIAIMLAFWVRFLLHWIFCMCCFYNDRASAIERLLLIPYLFLSGLVAPLETFPEIIKKIAYITPYPYIMSFPARLLSGQDVSLFLGFTGLIGWFILLFSISIITWKIAIRHYSAMGA